MLNLSAYSVDVLRTAHVGAVAFLLGVDDGQPQHALTLCCESTVPHAEEGSPHDPLRITQKRKLLAQPPRHSRLCRQATQFAVHAARENDVTLLSRTPIKLTLYYITFDP